MDVYLVEAEASQHGRDCASSVVRGGLKDAILQCILLKLALSFSANFAFEVWIRGRKKASFTRIDSRSCAIDPSAQNFRWRKVNRHFLVVDFDIPRLQICKIDPCNNFPMHNEQQAITGQKVRQISISVSTRDDLIRRVADSLQSLKLLNLTNYSRLVHVSSGLSAQNTHEVQ